MRIENNTHEVKSPEQPKVQDNNVELRSKQKNSLDENSVIGKSEARITSKSKAIDDGFKSIKEKTEGFLDEFHHSGFEKEQDREKALGRNLVTVRDIQDLRTAIANEKEELWARHCEMAKDIPYSELMGNQEYADMSERYKQLESYEKALSAYEGTLDGRNYDLCKGLNKKQDELPYFQQADNYRYDKNGAIGAVEKYIDSLEKRIKSDKATPTDRFLADFQKSRVDEALSSYLDHGSKEQMDKASALSSRFDKCMTTLDEKYSDYKLYDNGTIETEKEHSFAVKKDKPDAKITKSPDGRTVTKTETESAFLSARLKTTQESFLYTGKDTGRKSIEADASVFKTSVNKTVSHFNSEGIVERIENTKAEESFLETKGKARIDVHEGSASVKAEATGIHSEMSYENKHGDVSEKFIIESNVGHAEAKAEIDAKTLTLESSASADVADVKGSVEHSIKGNKTSTEFEAKALDASVKAGFNETGNLYASAVRRPVDIGIKVKENGATLINTKDAGAAGIGDAISMIKRPHDLKVEEKRAESEYIDSQKKDVTSSQIEVNKVDKPTESSSKTRTHEQHEKDLEENGTI